MAKQSTSKARPAERAAVVTGKPKAGTTSGGAKSSIAKQGVKPVVKASVTGTTSTTKKSVDASPASKEPSGPPVPEDTTEQQPPSGEAAPQKVNQHPKSSEPRIGLARTLLQQLAILQEGGKSSAKAESVTSEEQRLVSDIQKYYTDALTISPGFHDAYIELGSFLEKYVSLEDAADLFAKFPFQRNEDSSKVETNQDDLFIHSEITRTYMKLKRYKHPALIESLIAEGRAMGIGTLSKYMEILDAAGESNTLMQVYAGVNRKSVEDPDMVAFFKVKYWL